MRIPSSGPPPGLHVAADVFSTSNIQSVHDKIDDLIVKLNLAEERLTVMLQETKSFHSALQDRIHMIERVFCFVDFEEVNEAIKCVRKGCGLIDSRCDPQPDKEPSPDKMLALGAAVVSMKPKVSVPGLAKEIAHDVDDNGVARNLCEEFDIFSDAGMSVSCDESNKDGKSTCVAGEEDGASCALEEGPQTPKKVRYTNCFGMTSYLLRPCPRGCVDLAVSCKHCRVEAQLSN